MLQECDINKLDLFIKGWYIDPKVCDDMIALYEKSDKHEGLSVYPDKPDKSFKDSTDVMIPPDSEFLSAYLQELKTCTNFYQDMFPFFHKELFLREFVNIQHYNVGGGFKAWHCERVSSEPIIKDRILVFMTYLNDVDDGGTEFYHQNITTKAQKGLTLLWPPDWTYVHRGQISQTKEKYIITGWLSL